MRRSTAKQQAEYSILEDRFWMVAIRHHFDDTVNAICSLTTLEDINQSIKGFWEIENSSAVSPIHSEEERDCEIQFCQTIKRDKDGRFIASLPWKSSYHLLGNSFNTASKRLIALERRLKGNEALRIDYSNFLKEYEQLNHMSLLNYSENADGLGYFMPHHAVFKADSSTTKTRVVFDASSQTTTGKPLDDLLMIGVVAQDDLFTILIRFRFHEYVLKADISKMYRQILISEDDRKFQRILWRRLSEDPIDIYELKTLTYGTRPASFIATRCLKEIALLTNLAYPLAARAIESDFYMDDLLTGANTLAEALALQNQITTSLSSYGFELRKWASNDRAVLREVPVTEQETISLLGRDKETLKTLGIFWDTKADQIHYVSELNFSEKRITKRTILSLIAQIFDPIGLLGPVVVAGKLIMQRLWKLNLGWDEALPEIIHTEWREFILEFQNLKDILIPRQVIVSAAIEFELHGFADASESAYGACVYIKSRAANDKIQCSLLCAKSRVAPIKVITLPRLELCAALLLAQLVKNVRNFLCIHFSKISYYTDSTITIAWIKTCSSKLKTFVSHRVAEIQCCSDVAQWYHMRSEQNPADVISRGSRPFKLVSLTLWWHGPEWLISNEIPTDPEIMEEFELPEKMVLVVNVAPRKNELVFRYSNLNRLLRVAAWCHRFAHNARNKNHKLLGRLTVDELIHVETILIRSVQEEEIPQEMHSLTNKRDLSTSCSILSLNPFIDESGLIRVGGRLRNADIQFDAQHQMLLPRNHHLTELIVEDCHIKSLHAGIFGTLSEVCLRYWPVAGKNAVRKVVRSCLTCFKSNPNGLQPIMGNLPRCRLKPEKPFTRTGIDYFGPLYIKEGSRRTKRVTKGYGCLFICMVSKAVHLELVSTETFLSALRRFVARRGWVSEVYSDNGTNFVGANNELREIYDFISKKENQERISNELANRRIKWFFNPPRAPHFGELWESSVKRVKHHLYRIAGNAHLTFEEMSTLLSEIEATLNSRPLLSLSNDPNEYSFLTPGHFLVGDHLHSIEQPDFSDTATNRLSRWQRVTQLQQHFWKRWSREYLCELQRRNKWTKPTANLQPHQLVVIKEDNLPPRQWKLGRVEVVHPGADGIVRVVSVRTVQGIVKRPVTKLCLLPLQDSV